MKYKLLIMSHLIVAVMAGSFAVEHAPVKVVTREHTVILNYAITPLPLHADLHKKQQMIWGAAVPSHALRRK